MSRKTYANDTDSSCGKRSKPMKKITSLPNALLRTVIAPVCWINDYKRDGSLGRFIRKWYFGDFC